ncbi:MAG: hypothetical protein JXA00_03470 [Candidatus Thermoplasmatota archaeon]|nr:hypothetical protein [Candidatus Thermoplasmatota archaeon]
MKKTTQVALLKLCVFVIIANLPFLTMTQLLGIDTFLDSFYHPSCYQCLKTDKVSITDTPSSYLIVQNPTHHEYQVTPGDTILYHSNTDTILYQRVMKIQVEKGIKTYYTATGDMSHLEGPIYEYQILGKITERIDDTLWNALSVHLWDLSIENLNAAALFTNT